MSLEDKIKKLLHENTATKGIDAEQTDETTQPIAENTFDFTAAEREHWDAKDYKDDQEKIEFILQNQQKVPGRVVMFSLEQLEDMKADELDLVFNEIFQGLGLKEKYTKPSEEHLSSRADQIGFILRKEKELISPQYWFKNIVGFHNVGDSEVERLYNLMVKMIKATSPDLASLNEDSIDEKHIKTRKDKIRFILQKQKELYKDVRDWFNDDDLSLFANKYIDKLYHQIERAALGKQGLAEQVNWEEVAKAMSTKDYAKVAQIFDTTTKLGADDIVDALLAKGYSTDVVANVVREIFGDPEIPDYFKDKLNNANQYFYNSEHKPEEPIEEQGTTTADMAVPMLPAGGPSKQKKPETWAGLEEEGPMGATLSQLDLTPDPLGIEKEKENQPDDTLYENISNLDATILEPLYIAYVNEAIDKKFGDECADPTHKSIKEHLIKYGSKNKIDEMLEAFEEKQVRCNGEWKFGEFLEHLNECLSEKKSTVSDRKGKVLNEKPIFKNNEANEMLQTLTQNSMANEERYPVPAEDIKLLEDAAATLNFKVLAVRGALKESGRDDKYEIVVEKQSTRALVEYFDNDAKPFVVESRKFTTLKTALGFIAENADRFTTEQVEDTFNQDATKRALKEAQDLESFTNNALENYKKERAKYEGREIEIMKKIMTEEELKRGIYFRKK